MDSVKIFKWEKKLVYYLINEMQKPEVLDVFTRNTNKNFNLTR